MAFSRFLSFWKTFLSHVFVTTKYGMKRRRFRWVSRAGRGRVTVRMAGVTSILSTPEPSLGLPEATAGEGWYSPHFFCVRLHKCHSLDSLEPLLPAQRAPSTRHFPVRCLSLLITITCILPYLDTCAVLRRVVLLGAWHLGGGQ